MVSGHSRAGMDLVACRTIEMMGDLIEAMERAAEQIADEEPLHEIDVSKYQLYMASEEKTGIREVLCTLEIDECFEIISSAASESGVCLDSMTRLEIEHPAAEFGENMISGGFDAFKGISVDMRNDQLEELLDLICEKLLERNLTMRCTEDEKVIFTIPVRKRE